MFTRHAPVALVVALALLAAGCQPVILIVKPDRNNPNDPVTDVVVNFTTNFKPTEAWNVQLDGANLAGFSPTPIPGGTSSVPITLPSGFAHKVTAQGTCGTLCAYPSDEVNFSPPALMYNSASYVNGSQNLRQFVPVTVFVGVQNFRSVPINVTIVETTSPHHVKLATATGAFLPPGAPLTVTIPASTTKADFRIQGDVLGTYNLRFTSPGTAQGFGAGTITP